MREALAARSGRDVLVAGAQRTRTGLGAGAKAARAAKSVLTLAVRRRSVLVRGALVLGATLAVGVNALSWQTARHPAPMFAQKPAHAEPAGPRRLEAALPVPPVRPALPAAAPAAAPAAPPAAPARPPATRDPAGEPVRAGETGSLKADPHKTVASVQRALAKAGFGPLKADGVMGAGTRQALERFERSRGLAPTGDLTPRTLRELAAQTGSTIE